jgi:hypothetical protein
MTLVDVKTPAGIYLGRDWAFDFDYPVMNLFVERLSRALLWYEFGQPHFNGAFGWRMNLEMPTLVGLRGDATIRTYPEGWQCVCLWHNAIAR